MNLQQGTGKHFMPSEPYIHKFFLDNLEVDGEYKWL